MIKSVVIWILGILGWALSYILFVKWLVANEWNFLGGWAQAFTSSDFATGLLLDLVVVTVMMVVVAIWDRRRLGALRATAVVASLGLSVSVSLAIYLVSIWRMHQLDVVSQSN